MLEERPIVQKSLLGAGAFMFVFTAAMGGTGFMLTGGLGLGDDNPSSPPATLTQASTGEWADLSANTPQIVYRREPAPATVTPVSMTFEPEQADMAQVDIADSSDDSMLGEADTAAPAAALPDFPTLDKPDKVPG